MKSIHIVKGDKFYYGYDVNKLPTCRSGGFATSSLLIHIVNMYIQRLFLRFKIYDCSDPVGNLRPKNVVCRNSVSFVKQSYDRVYDLRPFVKQCLVVGLFMFWISWVSQLFFVLFLFCSGIFFFPFKLIENQAQK